MSNIKVYHDMRGIWPPRGEKVVFMSCGDEDNREYMKELVESGEVFTVYTEYETSMLYGPCGCDGYDPCDWHRGYDKHDFADCLCSEKYNIKCNYHSGDNQNITVIHGTEEEDVPEGGVFIHSYSLWCQSTQKMMRDLVKKGEKVTVYTDAAVETPCGCGAGDFKCEWHTRKENAEFAMCLCSRVYGIRCNSHNKSCDHLLFYWSWNL